MQLKTIEIHWVNIPFYLDIYLIDYYLLESDNQNDFDHQKSLIDVYDPKIEPILSKKFFWLKKLNNWFK